MRCCQAAVTAQGEGRNPRKRPIVPWRTGRRERRPPRQLRSMRVVPK
jgi:hypothetical protein